MGMKPVGGLEERKLVTVLFADLAPEAREKVLAEIRHMLESVNGILRGVATNDLVAVEKAARAAGTAVAVEMEPAMMRQLLPAFASLGCRPTGHSTTWPTGLRPGARVTTPSGGWPGGPARPGWPSTERGRRSPSLMVVMAPYGSPNTSSIQLASWMRP
jgi:hypothetical protein